MNKYKLNRAYRKIAALTFRFFSERAAHRVSPVRHFLTIEVV